MEVKKTPSGERVRIGFFGKSNVGKSSLANAVAGQAISAVSETRGTTTAPVKRDAELRPLGPAAVIDTPGLDEEEDGPDKKRAQKTRQVLEQTDIAVLVADAGGSLGRQERDLLQQLRSHSVPYVVAYNKADLVWDRSERGENEIYVSAVTGENINALREMLGSFAREIENPRRLASDLVPDGAMALLVVPIDEADAGGRLILPQQQTMRDLLDAHRAFSVCQPAELRETLASFCREPRLVVADSRALGAAARIVPEDVPFTSFSILFARYKGNLRRLVRGAEQLAELRSGDRVLISVGCRHHKQCGDLGTLKLPGWIEACTGVRPVFTYSTGETFPEDPSGYALIVHCGGCMLGEREMRGRMARAALSGVPMVNFGVAIAQMQGLLERCLRPFPELSDLLPEGQPL